MKPILFNTEMVRAILEGRKTATRRICKGDKPPCEVGDVLWVRETWQFWPCITCGERDCTRKPEVYEDAEAITEGCWIYRADGETTALSGLSGGICWRPAIHMPKAAARIFLKVKSVYPAKLQESFLGAAAPMREIQREGIQIYEECETCIKTGKAACVWTMGAEEKHECGLLDQPLWEFTHLWDSTVPRGRLDREGWTANPEVWVIRFERVEKPEGWPG